MSTTNPAAETRYLLRVETPVGVRCCHAIAGSAECPFWVLESRPIESWELDQVQSLHALVAELTDKGAWHGERHCDICDRDISPDEKDAEEVIDIHGKSVGWICGACWADRPEGVE